MLKGIEKLNNVVKSFQNLLFVGCLFVCHLSYSETRCDANQSLEISFPGSKIIANLGCLSPQLRPFFVIDCAEGVGCVLCFNFRAPFYNPCTETTLPVCSPIVRSLLPNVRVALPLAANSESVSEQQNNKSTSNGGSKVRQNLEECFWHFLSGVAGAITILVAKRLIAPNAPKLNRSRRKSSTEQQRHAPEGQNRAHSERTILNLKCAQRL